MAWLASTRWLTSPLLVTQTPSGSPALSPISMPTVVNWIHLRARPLSRTRRANSAVKAELYTWRISAPSSALARDSMLSAFVSLDLGKVAQEGFVHHITGGVHKLSNANCHGGPPKPRRIGARGHEQEI